MASNNQTIKPGDLESLTSDEELTQREEFPRLDNRRLANRASATRSRLRKKMQFRQQSGQLDALRRENQELRALANQESFTVMCSECGRLIGSGQGLQCKADGVKGVLGCRMAPPQSLYRVSEKRAGLRHFSIKRLVAVGAGMVLLALAGSRLWWQRESVQQGWVKQLSQGRGLQDEGMEWLAGLEQQGQGQDWIRLERKQ